MLYFNVHFDVLNVSLETGDKTQTMVGIGERTTTASNQPLVNTTSKILTVVVRIRATVKGYTRLTFRSDQFRSALAKTLGIDVTRITISSVDDARRRAADSGVAVTSNVGYPTGTNTAEVLSSVASSTDRLTANIRAEGMTDATVTALDPAVVSVTAAPGTASQSIMTNAAAAAIGVLGTLLLVILGVLCFRKPSAKPEPEIMSPGPASQFSGLQVPDYTAIHVNDSTSKGTTDQSWQEDVNPSLSSPQTRMRLLTSDQSLRLNMPVRQAERSGVEGGQDGGGGWITADLVVLGHP
jgi:hypothetical protein